MPVNWFGRFYKSPCEILQGLYMNFRNYLLPLPPPLLLELPPELPELPELLGAELPLEGEELPTLGDELLEEPPEGLLTAGAVLLCGVLDGAACG